MQSPLSQYQNANPASGERSHRAVFFDRDGVVNRRIVGGYVRSVEEFEMLPDILTVLPEVHRAGYLAVLVTNQRGIALGLMTEKDLQELHRWLQSELLERCGHTFDRIEFCPHGRDAGCDCRKPRPGMILRAAEALAIDIEQSWLIGDSASDIEAAHNAGCRAALIAPEGTTSDAEIIVPSLAQAWEEVKSIRQ